MGYLTDPYPPHRAHAMEDLAKLIEKARASKPSAADQEAQRRSFAYGNTKIENSRITHAIVDGAAKAIAKERGSGSCSK